MSANANTLPRFSDPRDVDEFVAKLEAFEQGAIGPDEFRAFRLVRGVYGQRQEGAQMIRVKIPFGERQRGACIFLTAPFGTNFLRTAPRHFRTFVSLSNRPSSAPTFVRRGCSNSVLAVG